jgi:hypothetical protein
MPGTKAGPDMDSRWILSDGLPLAPRHRGTAQAAGCSIAACGAGTQQARLGGFGGSQLVKGYVDEI